MLRNSTNHGRLATLFSAVCGALLFGDVAHAQSKVIGWGWRRFDSSWSQGPFASVEAGSYSTIARRTDGTFLAWGNTAGFLPVPALPAGVVHLEIVHTTTQCFGRRSDGKISVWPGSPTYDFGIPAVKLSAGRTHVLVLLADGTLRSLGDNTYGQGTIPPLPAGTTYVDVAGAELYSLAERSDGVIVSFGAQTLGTTPPPGRTFVQIAGGQFHNVGLLDDGTCVAWATSNNWGQANVPPLPPGMTYTKVDAGPKHSVALRSDGTAIAWGANTAGECNVPPLPPGMSYTDVSASGTDTTYAVTLLVRSDGQVVGTGFGGYGHFNAPIAPSGTEYVDVSATCTRAILGETIISSHVAALRNDGQVVVFGDTTYGRANVPPLPPGLDYVDVAAGGSHSVARRSDGAIVSFGSNLYGEGTVPPLAPGTSYVQSSASTYSSAARRNDGTVVSFGFDDLLPSPPPLPPGVTYAKVDAGYDHLVALRTDGQIVAWGLAQQNFGQLVVPPLPPGTTYVDVDAGMLHNLALRSDGQVVGFGWNAYGQAAPPPLAPGVSVVQLAAGAKYSAVLLSDGSVLVFGNTSNGFAPVPTLEPGERFVKLSAGEECLVAIVRRDWEKYGVGKTNSLGCVPEIGASGVPSATQSSGFVVSCTAVQNQAPGILIYTVNGGRASLPFQCGTLYVGPGGIQRTPLRFAGGSAFPAVDCTGNFSIDMNAFGAGLGGGVPDPALSTPSTVVHVQWWGRDAGFAPPCNTMLSNAIEYVIPP